MPPAAGDVGVGHRPSARGLPGWKSLLYLKMDLQTQRIASREHLLGKPWFSHVFTMSVQDTRIIGPGG